MTSPVPLRSRGHQRMSSRELMMLKKRIGRRNRFRSYESARKLVMAQGIKTQAQWYAWSKNGGRPKDIPSNPHIHYADEWESWGRFLGTNNVRRCRIKFRSFDEARRFASTLGLRTHREWQKWCKSGKRPQDIPSNPQSKYMYSGWQGWGHFLSPMDSVAPNLELMSASAVIPFPQSQQFPVMKQQLLPQQHITSWSSAVLPPLKTPQTQMPGVIISQNGSQYLFL